MSTSFMAQNIAQRERLRALVARLSDSDLTRDVGEGWTVTTVLVHLAFWDRQRLFTLRHWLQNGQLPQAGDGNVINNALAAISHGVPPRTAALLAVEAAEAIDYELEQLTPEQVAALESAGLPPLLNRHLHRRDHIEQIERALV
jgi:hypothetical protein